MKNEFSMQHSNKMTAASVNNFSNNDGMEEDEDAPMIESFYDDGNDLNSRFNNDQCFLK